MGIILDNNFVHLRNQLFRTEITALFAVRVQKCEEGIETVNGAASCRSAICGARGRGRAGNNSVIKLQNG